MTWLNYHHLLYFWTTAHEGTMSAAAKKLRVTLPTVSSQIRELEDRFGGQLFERRGSGLRLTALGKQVLGYADEIFALGEELSALVHGKGVLKAPRFSVGVVDALPKLVAMRVLRPVLARGEPVQLRVRQGSFDELLGELSTHSLDMVLSDVPISPHLHVRAFNHPLGASPVGVFAVEPLAEGLREGFPASLNDAPMLLPSEHGAMRRALGYWLEQRNITPRVVAEIEDSALLKAFAQVGEGAVVAPMLIQDELLGFYGLKLVGTCDGLDEHYYAISVERRIHNPAVAAVVREAGQLMGLR